jgi:hypothetical protein
LSVTSAAAVPLNAHPARADGSGFVAANPGLSPMGRLAILPAGWTTTNGTNVSGGHTGRWPWQLSGSASLGQQATGLPSGTYTLSAWIKGSGAAGAQLYAKGFGGTDKSTSLAGAGSNWSNLTVSGITVSNGTCQIGITATAVTIAADDFMLVKN